MKRARDDGRPFISPAEPSGLVQMVTESNGQSLTKTDALSYLKAVKDVFRDNRDKHDVFLEIMKDFKARRFSINDVIMRVKELFIEHEQLLLGFNIFLPKGYEITLPTEDQLVQKTISAEFDDAMNFFSKIKTRFQGDDHVLKAFFDILSMYRWENKPILEVYQEVEVLLHGHDDLLLEFIRFLPDTSGAASSPHAHLSSECILKNDDKDSPTTVARSMQVERHGRHIDSDQQSSLEIEKEKLVDKDEWEHDENFDSKRKIARRDDSAADLLFKALLAEIKEMSEKNLSESERLLSIGAGYGQPIKHNMEFDYSDPEVHEDLYQLMKYSCGEVFTPEQHEKIMTIWTTFLEPMLGAPSRNHSAEGTEDVRGNNHASKSLVSFGMEGNCSPLGKTSPGNGKSVGVFTTEDKNIPTEDMSCNVAQNEVTLADVNAAEEPSIYEKNPSNAQNETGGAVAVCEMESTFCHHLQAPSSATSTTGKILEETKTQNDHQEIEHSSRSLLEEGELPLTNELEENKFSTLGNTYAKASQTATETAGNMKRTEQLFGKVAIGESDANDDHDDTEGFRPFSNCLLQSAKPITIKVPMALLGRRNSQLFYGNDSFYLLFRLHWMVYERMQSAKMLSSSPENKLRTLSDASDSYARFKDALHNFLTGSSDNAKFEDDLRAIIGAQSDTLFTLEKLIHGLVKQLQAIASEETENKLLHLYEYERSRNPETFSESVYHANARFLLPGDNVYRIEYLPSSFCLTVQLMKNEYNELEVAAVCMDPMFVTYLNDDLLSVAAEKGGKPGIFLRRNIRKQATGDEITCFQKSMEGLVIHNGLDINVVCHTLKTAYVQGTEDFMCRISKRRKTLHRNSTSIGASSITSNEVPNVCTHREKRSRKLPFT